MQNLPNSRQILGAYLRFRRNSGQGRVRFPKSLAVSETPGSLKVSRVIGRLLRVEAENAPNGILLAICLDQHRMRREVNAVRRQNGMVGHFSGSLHILVQQRRRHGQRFPGIIEACGIGRIYGKLARDLHVLAREIANRIVILGVAEPSRQNNSRITRELPYLFRAHSLNPGDYLLCRFRRWRRQRLGRHLVRRQPLHNQRPAGKIVSNGVKGCIRTEVELRGRHPSAVAAGTILFNEGPDGLLKLLLQRRSCGDHRESANTQQGENGSKLHYKIHCVMLVKMLTGWAD